jgi:small conductance mechanosensitive channel
VTAASLLDGVARLLGRLLRLGEAATESLARLLVILVTILVGWVVYRLVVSLVERILRPSAGSADYTLRLQRARTLGPLVENTARYAVAFVVGVLVLQEVGIDVRAVMVSAGVAGLAVGLGAQSLIKDVITGFFLLFESLVAVGDVVEVGPHVGVVESVGLRVTKIRKFSGELRIVPNGELTSFGQHSAGWGRAVVEVGVDYAQDAGRTLRVLESVGKAFLAAHPGVVLEPPTAEGILRFGDADVVFRLHVRVDAQQKFPLELELRRRVKEALDAEDLGGPRAHRVVLLSTDARPGPGRAESR